VEKKTLLLKIFFLTFFVKVILSYFIPIAGDEAYYWVWGQNLQLSYFDHPGMVAWLSSLTNFFSILPKWFSLRIIFSLLSSLSLIVWLKCFILVRSEESNLDLNKGIIIFSIFYNLNPLLGIGGILATPDVPLVLFWSLSYWATLNILINPLKRFYMLLGVFLGLGFCSKYHIVLFPLTTLIALLFTKKIKLIKPKLIILTFIFGLSFSMPVIIWNIQNDFISFKFQLNHGFTSIYDYNPMWTLTYLVGQIFLLNPFIFWSSMQKNGLTFNKITSWSQWIFFLYSSFKAKVEANWPITSHASILLDYDFKNKALFKKSLYYFAGLWIIVIILAFTPTLHKKILLLPSSKTVGLIYSEIKDLSPIYGPTYQLSSLITLMTGKKVNKLAGLSRYDFYDTLAESRPGVSKFYVLKYNITFWPESYAQMNIKQIMNFPDIDLALYEITNE